MSFKVIEFGVLSHSVRPLSLLTPVATKYRMIEIKQPTKHFFSYLQKWSHSTFVLSANGSCYQPMMEGTCGPPSTNYFHSRRV